MKKLFLFAVLLLFASNIYGADPTQITYIITVGDVTIDSQFTESWKNIDSLIVAPDDSASTMFTITGVVALDPGDLLYIGFGNDSANLTSASSAILNNNLDSMLVKYPRSAKPGKIWMGFSHQYVLETVASLTDTVYINAACIGSTQSEQVELYDVVISAFIGNDPN